MKIPKLKLSKEESSSDQAIVVRFIGDLKGVRHRDILGLEGPIERGGVKTGGIARAYTAISELIDNGLVCEDGEEPFNTYYLTSRGETMYDMLNKEKRK